MISHTLHGHFPCRHKSDVLPTLISFHAFVRTQFQRDIQCLQTDNGREFDNNAARTFFSANGISLRLTCPYTSQQNGRAKRVFRTINDSLCALLFHASVPPSFWPDALATATHLLNRCPVPAANGATKRHRSFSMARRRLRPPPCVRLSVLPQHHSHCAAQARATIRGMHFSRLPD